MEPNKLVHYPYCFNRTGATNGNIRKKGHGDPLVIANITKASMGHIIYMD